MWVNRFISSSGLVQVYWSGLIGTDLERADSALVTCKLNSGFEFVWPDSAPKEIKR